MSKENRISCPFCGGEMVRPFNTSHFMHCTNCGAQSPFTHNFTDVEREARKRADRPKGKWGIRVYPANASRSRSEMIVCRECNTEFSYDAETGSQAADWPYCPNCGAEMEVQQ